MKRTLYILAAVFILILVVSFSLNPLITFLVRQQIKKAVGLEAEGILVKVNPLFMEAELNIAKIKYGQLKIEELKASGRVKQGTLSLSSLSAKALGGLIEGNLDFKLRDAGYLADLKFINLNLERFVEDFRLRERFQLSGRLNGRVLLKGTGPEIKVLSGDLSSLEPGGRLNITDSTTLENMASRSSQDLDILVESFKNYYYNKGLVKLSLKEDDLIFEVAMDGALGKRNLNITLHNFFHYRKEGL